MSKSGGSFFFPSVFLESSVVVRPLALFWRPYLLMSLSRRRVSAGTHMGLVEGKKQKKKRSTSNYV